MDPGGDSGAGGRPPTGQKGVPAPGAAPSEVAQGFGRIPGLMHDVGAPGGGKGGTGKGSAATGPGKGGSSKGDGGGGGLDTEAVSDLIKQVGSMQKSGRSFSPSTKVVAGIVGAGLVAAVVAVIVLVAGGGSGGNSSPTSLGPTTSAPEVTAAPSTAPEATVAPSTTEASTTTVEATTTVPLAEAPILAGTTFAIDMVSVEANNGIAPVHNEFNPQTAVGDHIPASLVFGDQCTPESCVATYVIGETSGRYSIWGLLHHLMSSDDEITFTYQDGTYRSTASGQVGCGGFPPRDGLPTTLGTVTFELAIVSVDEATGEVNAIGGTVATTFADPYTQLILEDRQRYCENTWGTLEFTGAPA